MRIAFHVPGQPATKGSSVPVPTAKGWRVKADNARLKGWERTVATVARSAMVRASGIPPDDEAAIPAGPVALRLVFWIERPGRHFVGGSKRRGRLRPSAPLLHATRFDLDKLARAIGDALVKARLIGDDGQIARIEAEKRWADPLMGPGVRIELETLNDEREVA